MFNRPFRRRWLRWRGDVWWGSVLQTVDGWMGGWVDGWMGGYLAVDSQQHKCLLVDLRL
ncbi:MAG: hypothetical protein QNJ46_16510 [Leptolyngbyaceae cyanobacterium MO_188.B28]|nr:hypothetical protein [Leptolyngbyaceae cyanobacterium MO_188.B28]